MKVDHESELRQAQNEAKRLKLEAKKQTLEHSKSPVRNQLASYTEINSVDLSRFNENNSHLHAHSQLNPQRPKSTIGGQIGDVQQNVSILSTASNRLGR